MTVGIYTITEISTGKMYVGQSKNIESDRWKRHQKKYPTDTFSYKIEQECCVGLLDVLERYFIKKFNTKTPNGLNKTNGGNGTFGNPSSSTKAIWSAQRTGKPQPCSVEKARKMGSISRPAWNKGISGYDQKKRSDEQRERMAEARRLWWKNKKENL